MSAQTWFLLLSRDELSWASHSRVQNDVHWEVQRQRPLLVFRDERSRRPRAPIEGLTRGPTGRLANLRDKNLPQK